MTGQCSCSKQRNECNKCNPLPCRKCQTPEHPCGKCQKPEPPVCYSCTKPLYEIITYPHISIPCFNVIINTHNRRIEGFILNFVDDCGVPICFDNYESFMSVEILTECGPRLVSCENKIYYTYTEQSNNCMPINPALWTYRYPTSATLRLSFRLRHCYTRSLHLNINMFYGQNQCPHEKLGPVIDNAIRSDNQNHCVEDPCYPGYVSWMVSQRECCDDGYIQRSSDDYPYGH